MQSWKELMSANLSLHDDLMRLKDEQSWLHPCLGQNSPGASTYPFISLFHSLCHSLCLSSSLSLAHSLSLSLSLSVSPCLPLSPRAWPLFLSLSLFLSLAVDSHLHSQLVKGQRDAHPGARIGIQSEATASWLERLHRGKRGRHPKRRRGGKQPAERAAASCHWAALVSQIDDCMGSVVYLAKLVCEMTGAVICPHGSGLYLGVREEAVAERARCQPGEGWNLPEAPPGRGG